MDVARGLLQERPLQFQHQNVRVKSGCNPCPTCGHLLSSQILYALLVGEQQHKIARARFCTQSCSKVGQLLVNSSPTPHPIGSCMGSAELGFASWPHSSKFFDLLPHHPYPPCKNGTTHGTSFCNTRGHMPIDSPFKITERIVVRQRLAIAGRIANFGASRYRAICHNASLLQYKGITRLGVGGGKRSSCAFLLHATMQRLDGSRP